jgi:hypothetical protein
MLQERIMTMPYGIGPDAEVFKYSLFLVFCNRVVAASIAAITLVVSSWYSQDCVSAANLFLVHGHVMLRHTNKQH